MEISKRERIVLGLMAAAIVASAVMLAWPSEKTASSEMAPEKLVESRNKAEAALASLELIQATPTEIHAVISARQPWTRDPMAPRPADPESPVERDRFAYTGFLRLGDKLLAVINGREYQAGEQLESGGFVVSSITPEAVELTNVTRRNTLRIPYQDPSFFDPRQVDAPRSAQ